MGDSYDTIHHRAHAEMKVRGSRFLADVVPVEARAQVEEFLDDVRRRLYDATHHCYAYRIGTKGEVYRAHDDGEPGGSAGRPILAAIDRIGLTDLLVVVTRYFGGTKLGVGGLARAYGEAAAMGLREAGQRTLYLTGECTLRFSHADISAVMRVVSQLQARILDTQYDAQVVMRVEVRQSLLDRLHADLVAATRGRVQFDPPPPGGLP